MFDPPAKPGGFGINSFNNIECDPVEYSCMMREPLPQVGERRAMVFFLPRKPKKLLQVGKKNLDFEGMVLSTTSEFA